ncbi:hypothetical protein NML39_003818, partial [Shigella flexneri]|nr:hypothetical protein [Shigella flexneri]MCP5564162.1 hypothetical protein [Shigella flexneri]
EYIEIFYNRQRRHSRLGNISPAAFRENIIRWLLKKRTNGSVRYCQYTSKVAMIYIEQLELIHKSGDVLYPVKITRKSSGKTAFHLVPFGLNKTHDLLEVEDASEAIRLVIDERHSIRCSTLTATITNKKGKRIKRTGIYSIKGVNIKEYNVR